MTDDRERWALILGASSGMGEAAALALARRFEEDRIRNRDRFTCSEQIFNHYHHGFRDRKKEHFLALLLDGGLRRGLPLARIVDLLCGAPAQRPSAP